jgi:hypothetical protein
MFCVMGPKVNCGKGFPIPVYPSVPISFRIDTGTVLYSIISYLPTPWAICSCGAAAHRTTVQWCVFGNYIPVLHYDIYGLQVN